MLKLKSDRYFSVAEEHENEITIIANEDVKDTYLELAKDVTLTVSQYMSTENRPIYSWDVPKDASLLNDDSLRAEPEKLPQTGQLWWPVPLLFCAGLIFVAAGLIIRRRRGNSDDR